MRIEDSPYPLAFKIAERPPKRAEARESGKIVIRTKVRSLAGMQKEAIVAWLQPARSSWCMVCDEGPYLNGTDLAPFPLAFYTAGMQFCYMSQLLKNAKQHGIGLKSLEVLQENYYSMKGSFLKGDAKGGARPVGLQVKIESDDPVESIAKLVQRSEASSPSHAAMRTRLSNAFALTFNGRPSLLSAVTQSEVQDTEDPISDFDDLQPGLPQAFLPDIITKLETAEQIHQVAGGVSSSLQAVQNRELHVHGEAKLTDLDQVKQTTVRLYKPIGSTFGFLSDDTATEGGKDCAPDGLAFLSAGLAFCYLTQITRYAQIAKLKLTSVRLVQETAFTFSGSRSDWSLAATAQPVHTHIFMDADESEKIGEKVVAMAAQTCFLHAALSGEFQTIVRAELNGRPIPV